MKKILFLTLTAIMTMTSCQKEGVQGASSSDEALVTITAKAPAAIGTKAAPAAVTGYELTYVLEIYNGTTLYRREAAQTSNVFNVRVITGQEYNFVFFAYHKSTNIATYPELWDASDLSAIEMKEAGSRSSLARDAFFGSATKTVNESFSLNVELKRPFAQINVKTLDKAYWGNLAPTQVKIEYTANAAFSNKFSAVSGDLLTSTFTPTYTRTEFVGSNGELSLDYILAPKTGTSTLDFKMTFYNAADQEITSNDSFTSIEYRRNTKTMISGNLLTKSGKITASIIDSYETPDLIILHPDGSTSNSADLEAVLTTGVNNGDIVILTQDKEYDFTSTSMTIDKDITIMGNGATINVETPASQSLVPNYQGQNPAMFITSTGTVKLVGLNISTNKTPNGPVGDGITLMGSGTLILEDVTFDGIMNVGGFTGSQSGRCVTVYGSAILKVTNCIFKNFNKNGIQMYGTSTAIVKNSSFIGNNVSGVSAQNGIVFMQNSPNNASGSVTDCIFSDLIYDGDTACAVLLYNDGTGSATVTNTNNTFTNNDRDWYEGI